MSIVRDCVNRKKNELNDQQTLIQAEIQKHLEQKKRADNAEMELQALQQNVYSLNSDVQIQQNERQTLCKNIEKQAQEIVALKQQISDQKSKQVEDIEVITILRKQIDVMKSERDEKVREIQGLKTCLNKNESSVENQHQMYLKCQAEIKKM